MVPKWRYFAKSGHTEFVVRVGKRQNYFFCSFPVWPDVWSKKVANVFQKLPKSNLNSFNFNLMFVKIPNSH